MQLKLFRSKKQQEQQPIAFQARPNQRLKSRKLSKYIQIQQSTLPNVYRRIGNLNKVVSYPTNVLAEKDLSQKQKIPHTNTNYCNNFQRASVQINGEQNTHQKMKRIGKIIPIKAFKIQVCDQSVKTSTLCSKQKFTFKKQIPQNSHVQQNKLNNFLRRQSINCAQTNKQKNRVISINKVTNLKNQQNNLNRKQKTQKILNFNINYKEQFQYQRQEKQQQQEFQQKVQNFKSSFRNLTFLDQKFQQFGCKYKIIVKPPILKRNKQNIFPQVYYYDKKVGSINCISTQSIPLENDKTKAINIQFLQKQQKKYSSHKKYRGKSTLDLKKESFSNKIMASSIQPIPNKQYHMKQDKVISSRTISSKSINCQNLYLKRQQKQKLQFANRPQYLDSIKKNFRTKSSLNKNNETGQLKKIPINHINKVYQTYQSRCFQKVNKIKCIYR